MTEIMSPIQVFGPGRIGPARPKKPWEPRWDLRSHRFSRVWQRCASRISRAQDRSLYHVEIGVKLRLHLENVAQGREVSCASTVIIE
jgi:hypothetical protein